MCSGLFQSLAGSLDDLRHFLPVVDVDLIHRLGPLVRNRLRHPESLVGLGLLDQNPIVVDSSEILPLPVQQKLSHNRLRANPLKQPHLLHREIPVILACHITSFVAQALPHTLGQVQCT